MNSVGGLVAALHRLQHLGSPHHWFRRSLIALGWSVLVVMTPVYVVVTEKKIGGGWGLAESLCAMQKVFDLCGRVSRKKHEWIAEKGTSMCQT